MRRRAVARGTSLIERVFSQFPGGIPGLALLLLRTAVAGILIVQNVRCLFEAQAEPALWVVAAGALLAAALLIAGLYTPSVAASALLLFLASHSKLISHCSSAASDSPSSLVLISAVLLALAGLGPGAISVDALRFGPREIIIPLPKEPRE